MSTLLAPILQYFFTEHLTTHRQVSPRTIVAYRDSFRLLLQFLKNKTGKQPSTLCVEDLDASAILDFLESLEKQRDNQVCSRNARLTAIRSFFHVVALRDPASVGVVNRVLAIPRKRTDKRLVGYLTREEIDTVLAAPDQSTWIGRRDYALLLTMYNSGARLSEMTCMRRGQVKFDSTTYLQLHGKGRKERLVPLWTKTGRVLRNWFRELELKPTEVAFPSVRGTPLSSDGVDYILQQAVKRAAKACSSLLSKRVTPHLIRHPALCTCCKPEWTWLSSPFGSVTKASKQRTSTLRQILQSRNGRWNELRQRMARCADSRPTIRCWPFCPRFNIPSSFQ